ncbi:MAG: hypothetical protein JRF18_07270 [Deltaproteobacteria bacterium]|nr:hypothetical protein [Deltaproteobacteria bacterium]
MERRSEKDRRQHVDPRYQSAAYSEFVDGRNGGDRRKLDYQHMPGHPVQKRIMLIGVLVVVFLISLFFILSVALTKKSTHKTFRKKTITFGHYQHGGEDRALALRNAVNPMPRLRFS